MKRFTSVFALGLAAALSLSACGTATDTAADVGGAAVDAGGAAVDAGGAAVEKTGEVVGGATDAAGKTVAAAGDAAGTAATGAKDAVAGAAGGAVDSVMAMKDGVTGIGTSITSTLDAVKSGDFGAAQESFSSVETSWASLKGMVPAEAATGIEAKIAEVSTGLTAEKPDAAALTSALGGLTDLVGGLAK